MNNILININNLFNKLKNSIIISNNILVDKLTTLNDITFYESKVKSKRGNIFIINKYANYNELPTILQDELNKKYKNNIPEIIEENEIINIINSINRKTLKYVSTSDFIKKIHQQENINFIYMTFSEFNNIQKLKIYKSPTYNSSQSSEYYLGIMNGYVIYIRKSNHWGKFITNIYNYEDDCIDSDIYNRVGTKKHDWELIGADKNKNGEYKQISQIGYIYLNNRR